jgi:putative tricarboxylic transport membrane protein
MSAELSDNSRDRVTGALGLAVSTAYVLYAKGIEDSLLADAVGASGVPIAVGAMLGLASLALLIKTGLQATPVLASSSAQEITDFDKLSPNGVDVAGDSVGASPHPHRMAACLLLVLAAYVALLPLVGYVIAIALLIGAVAYLAGAREAKSIWLCALLAGPFLWSTFDWALKIRLPKGLLLPMLGI